MPARPLLIALPLAALALIPASTAARHVKAPLQPVLSAALIRADGSDAGIAAIRAWAGNKTLTLTLHGLPPGEHGVHIHAIGKCNTPDFASAGGHLNPAGHQHGSLNPAGSHMGDLPNLTVDAAGNASVSVPLAIADADLVHTLLGASGAAIVVHAGPDDYKTDPSGNSGKRIACGVFKID
jgi:Cu-Zn family superoxide dismutase